MPTNDNILMCTFKGKGKNIENRWDVLFLLCLLFEILTTSILIGNDNPIMINRMGEKSEKIK